MSPCLLEWSQRPLPRTARGLRQRYARLLLALKAQEDVWLADDACTTALADLDTLIACAFGPEVAAAPEIVGTLPLPVRERTRPPHLFQRKTA